MRINSTWLNLATDRGSYSDVRSGSKADMAT